MKDVKIITVDNSYRGEFESSLKRVEDHLKIGYTVENSAVRGSTVIYILTKKIKSC